MSPHPSLGYPFGRMSVLNESHNQMGSSRDTSRTELKRIDKSTERALVWVSNYIQNKIFYPYVHPSTPSSPSSTPPLLTFIPAVQSKLNTWTHPEINLLHTWHAAINFTQFLDSYICCYLHCIPTNMTASSLAVCFWRSPCWILIICLNTSHAQCAVT